MQRACPKGREGFEDFASPASYQSSSWPNGLKLESQGLSSPLLINSIVRQQTEITLFEG